MDNNILASSRGTEDEQILYRNIVIQTCQPSTVPTEDDLKDPTCTTKLTDLPYSSGNRLQNAADILGWKLPMFLQYVYDNTWLNFHRAGLSTPRFLEQTDIEFRYAQEYLFIDKGYHFTDDGYLLFPDYQPVLGLRKPANPPPWYGPIEGPEVEEEKKE